MEKEIKTEEASGDDYEYGGPSSCLSPNHPDLQPDQPLVTRPVSTTNEVKPTWCPKGRSIVWEHITLVHETQRALCAYCKAEFQIKGGTSALLRHLKTNHPAAINFDPDNPPPVARRKRRKEASQSDYTSVTADTRSYMDNLLEQFLIPEDQGQAPIHDPAPALEVEDPMPMSALQSRADSEIDEVIRTLAKENAQNGGDEPEPDHDIRKLLGMGDDVLAQSQFQTMPILQNMNPDEEKQVSSSSSSAAKKRKCDEVAKTIDLPSMEAMQIKNEKFLSLMSQIRRVPPSQAPPTNATSLSIATSSTAAINNNNNINDNSNRMQQEKYHQNASSALDFEAKVLHNRSMHSTIAREDAMTHYYRMKSRKLELEIKKLERELGEPSCYTSPIDEHEE